MYFNSIRIDRRYFARNNNLFFSLMLPLKNNQWAYRLLHSCSHTLVVRLKIANIDYDKGEFILFCHESFLSIQRIYFQPTLEAYISDLTHRTTRTQRGKILHL